MTEQQIIEWAREAGGVVKQNCLGNPMFEFTSLEISRFVNTVAAHAKAEERERCAKIAGRMFIRDSENYPAVIADAIRTMEDGICPNDPTSIIRALKD